MKYKKVRNISPTHLRKSLNRPIRRNWTESDILGRAGAFIIIVTLAVLIVGFGYLVYLAGTIVYEMMK